MEDTISRAEHEEFARRMTEENTRQNHRISKIEDMVSQINDLTVSVKEMSVSMNSMLKELEKQGSRLEELEGRDGEMWRRVAGHAVTAIISIVIGFIFAKIGM